MLRKLRLLALLLVLSTLPLTAQERSIKIKARPQAVMASNPYTNITVIVERNPNNRQMVLLWGSPEIGLEGSSYYQLEGEGAQRVFFRQIRFRTIGEYQVKAVVVKNDETYESDSVTVIVK